MSVFIFHWFTFSRCGLLVFEPLLTIEFTLATARPGRVLGPRCLSSSYPGSVTAWYTAGGVDCFGGCKSPEPAVPYSFAQTPPSAELVW